MSDHLLEAFTRQYIQAQYTPEITFAWQGGEPTLMGLDFFRKAIDYQRKYHQAGQKIINNLQTNATLLDDEWCRFFKQHNFLLGVSLDGPQELHDVYRLDKGRQPTFTRVVGGIRLLQKHRVDFNILACVNGRTSQHPLEVYHFLRDDIGAEFLQFIPIVENTGNPGQPLTARSVTGPAYGQFMISIFDEWVRKDVGHIFVQAFDVALAAWTGHHPGLCIHEPTCGRALAMEHNGDLYACDHFVDSKHLLGNMNNRSLVELINLSQQRQFGRDKKANLPPQCRKCHVRFICNGGCPKDRLLTSTEGEPGLNVLCEGYQAFFTHIDYPMRQMAELLQLNRAPAEIMHLMATKSQTGAARKTGRIRYKKSQDEVPHV
jgi:uncharacterized protein